MFWIDGPLVPKRFSGPVYINDQIVNSSTNSFVINNDEKDWTLNDFRDMRVNYGEPIFRKDIISRQPNYYIDKVINDLSIDLEKDWTQLESFRDKYLSIRLIFDTFDDVKLSLNYSVENEQVSIR